MENKTMLSAFTTTETLIGLAITSIILSFVFVIFSITSERIIDFKKQNEKVADINRFTYSLNKSIFDSESIQYNESEVSFTKFTGEEIKYNIYDDYCVRNSRNYSDTFNFPVKAIIVDTLKGKSMNILYQRFRFDIEADQQIHKFLFYKKLFASQFMNYEH